MTKILTKRQARDYLVQYHHINTSPSFFGKEGVLQIMRHLHSLQYDPLDVVGKNTDLTLQARVLDYKRNEINQLLYEDRILLDAWDKMMGVILAEDFPRLKQVRDWRTNLEVNTLKRRHQMDALDYEKDVLRLLKESPKYAKDIKLGNTKSQVWGHSKSSTATLDYLFHKGLIGVRSRHNTQKEYDLIERLIPQYIKDSSFSEKDFEEYYMLRRIESLGIMRSKKGIHLAGPRIYDNVRRNTIIQSLLKKDLIQEVHIEGVKDRCFISSKHRVLDNEIVPRISFLAPLDNMLWDRDFIEQVFDFKYKWEVYTPVKKREYGYYVLPILFKSNFVGRIEFEKHRGHADFKVKNLWLLHENEEIHTHLKDALNRFQHYLKA